MSHERRRRRLSVAFVATACFVVFVVASSIGVGCTVVATLGSKTACNRDVVANVTSAERLSDGSCRLGLVYNVKDMVGKVTAVAEHAPCTTSPFFEGCYNHRAPHDLRPADTRILHEDKALLSTGIFFLVVGALPVLLLLGTLAALMLCCRKTGGDDDNNSDGVAAVVVRDSATELAFVAVVT